MGRDRALHYVRHVISRNLDRLCSSQSLDILRWKPAGYLVIYPVEKMFLLYIPIQRRRGSDTMCLAKFFKFERIFELGFTRVNIFEVCFAIIITNKDCERYLQDYTFRKDSQKLKDKSIIYQFQHSKTVF